MTKEKFMALQQELQESSKPLMSYLQDAGNCMVHIRRHFEKALDENKAAAEYALTQIQHLYKIEHMCDDANLSFDERKEKRQQLSKPIMEAMKQWMETEGVKYSQSSEIGKAVTYAYTRWDNMMHYLEDGRLLLDNNLAENEIRPITLGRKRLWSLCYAFS